MKVFARVFKSLGLGVLLVLSFQWTAAQGSLELKANMLPLLLDNIELSGEYLINQHFGIEVGIGYEWNESRSGYLDTLTGNSVWTRISENRKVNFYFSGKYYFSPKHGNDRFFIGILVDHQFYTQRKLNGQDIEKPKGTTSIGVEPGYKWVIKQRFPIEVGTRWFVYLEKNGFGEKIYNLGLFLNGKIGYRF